VASYETGLRYERRPSSLAAPHMKKFTMVVAAIAFLAPVALPAASFEGKVKMLMTSTNERPMPITMSLKPGFMRMEMQAEGQTVSMIMDQAKGTATVLMPDAQMYMVHQLPKADANAEGNKTSGVTIEKTSEHEKILGYDTTKYIAKAKDSTTEAWVTDQLGTFMGLGGGNPMGGSGGRHQQRGGGSGDQAWEEAFRGQEMFPLRVVSKATDGKVFKMEATAVDKVALPATEFTPPKEYHEFNMENMMKGMGVPRGRPGDE
jgi:hypothetical protein